MTNATLIDLLNKNKQLTKEQWVTLISSFSDEDRAYAAEIARKITDEKFGRKIYIRGIVEFSNICKNDCIYCGIRKSNTNVERYRLTKEQILDCCDKGYGYGFRTFVLQSGEDKFFTADKMTEIISEIKAAHPDCAVTVSMGEMSRSDYEKMFAAGADRYLLRHETADKSHYEKLHPSDMSWKNRMNCLEELKDIGYQTGCGMMIGSPFQTAQCLAEDMIFMGKFKPHMIGLGPFIPHKDTPFADRKQGSLELTLFMLSLCRIMLPNVLLPATTALGTIDPKGREMGVMAGANVVMPNLSPLNVRKKYLLYDNKICTGDESAQCISCMQRRMESIGCKIEISRGDYKE